MGASSFKTINVVNVIWIDKNIDNKENTGYTKILKEYNVIKLNLFNHVDEAINYMETIKFEETKVIISGRLYNELVKKFQQKLKDMSITPKIVIFTSNRQNFLQNNKEYED